MVFPAAHSSCETPPVAKPAHFGEMVEECCSICRNAPVQQPNMKTVVRLFVGIEHVNFNCRVIKSVCNVNPRRLFGPDEADALGLPYHDSGEYTRLAGFVRVGLLGFARCQWYSPALASNRVRMHKAIVAMVRFMTDDLYLDALRAYADYTEVCAKYEHHPHDLSFAHLQTLAAHKTHFTEFFNSAQFAPELDGPTLADYLEMTGEYDADELTEATNSFVHCIQWFTERYRTYVNRAVCGREIAGLVAQIPQKFVDKGAGVSGA